MYFSVTCVTGWCYETYRNHTFIVVYSVFVTGWADQNHENHKIILNSCISVLLSVTVLGYENHENNKISVK